MFSIAEMTVLVAALLGLVFLGVHIAVALGISSVLGIYLMQGNLEVVRTFIAHTAYEALRDYVFAVIPLFMLMGEFLAKCGAARDLYTLINQFTRVIPGRLAFATVLSNAVFAFVTGVSIAAAAAFSKIAYPEMKRHGYERRFAVGCIAGSACLGMLIPPSVLMIVWGVLTEQSIGKLFLAGVLPGFLLALLFSIYVFGVALVQPARVGAGLPAGGGGLGAPGMATDTPPAAIAEGRELWRILGGTLLIVGLVIGVLAGIWLGFFTPTEGAGVGAALALVLALAKGLRAREVFETILEVGRTSAPILLLLVAAQLYSRVLSMMGLTGAAKALLVGTGLSPYQVLTIMVLVWFLLGCIIDSISILLITVPVFAPLAADLGFEPLAFAILGILAVETGLLTPPFGILVFTVKAALPDEAMAVGEIFRGSIAYWLALVAVIVIIAAFPGIATYLPTLGR